LALANDTTTYCPKETKIAQNFNFATKFPKTKNFQDQVSYYWTTIFGKEKQNSDSIKLKVSKKR